MADNATLNPGSGGQVVRAIAKSANTNAITQSVVLDIGGGADSSPETIVSSANPLPVTVSGTVSVSGTFYQATQPVSAAALPLPAGAATSALQPALNGDGGALAHVTNFPATQAVSLATLPALAAGSNAIGSITNTSFGISGTLPAFAATPTVNLGMLNGAATATLQSSILTALGSPYQAGGALGAGTNTIGATLSVISAPTQISFTPNTTAYASGYALGASGANAVQSVTVPSSGILQNFGVMFSSGTYTSILDLFVFTAAPGSYTDGAAVTLSAADAAKLLCVIHCNDNTSLGGALSFTQAIGQAISYSIGSNTTLYLLPVMRGANTFAGSSTVTINFDIVR